MMKFPTKLENLVPPAALGKFLEILNQPALSSTVREALQKVGIKEGNPIEQVQNAWHQARGWLESVAQRMLDLSQANPALINASGQLVLPQWTSLPVSSAVAESIASASLGFQDHVKLEEHARHVAVGVTGGEDVALVTSLHAAIEGIARVADFQNGLVVPRTDAIRVLGFMDVREALAHGTTRLSEIGAVNGTRPEDWPSGTIMSMQAIVLVSPNCLDHQDALAQREQALRCARASNLPIIEILCDALAHKDAGCELNLPIMRERLASGADLVMAPLDWLIGGPAGAIVAGKSRLIASLTEYYHKHGMHMRGPSLAGAAVAMSSEPSSEFSNNGIARMLSTSAANLADRCRRIVTQIEGTARVKSVRVHERPTRLGPAPWNRYHISSCAIAIETVATAEQMRGEMLSAQHGPAIVCGEADGCVVLDLRWVDPSQDHFLVSAVLGQTAVKS